MTATWVIKKDKMRLWTFEWIQQGQKLSTDKWAPSLPLNILVPCKHNPPPRPPRKQLKPKIKMGEIPDN